MGSWYKISTYAASTKFFIDTLELNRVLSWIVMTVKMSNMLSWACKLCYTIWWKEAGLRNRKNYILLVFSKLMQFNQVKSTNRFLIEFESNFRVDFSGPIYSSRRSKSKSRSEFESEFEFGPRKVDFIKNWSNFSQIVIF